MPAPGNSVRWDVDHHDSWPGPIDTPTPEAIVPAQAAILGGIFAPAVAIEPVPAVRLLDLDCPRQPARDTRLGKQGLVIATIDRSAGVVARHSRLRSCGRQESARDDDE